MRSFIRLAMAIAVVCALGSQARAAYMFDAPISVAVDNLGNLIISEPGRHRIDKYNSVRQPRLALAEPRSAAARGRLS